MDTSQYPPEFEAAWAAQQQEANPPPPAAPQGGYPPGFEADYNNYLKSHGFESQVSNDIRNEAASQLNQSFPEQAAQYVGEAALSGLAKVGDVLGRYSAAPTRAAIGAAQQGQNPIPAFINQVGQPQEQAPTGKQLVENAGVTSRPLKEFLPEFANQAVDKYSGGLLKAATEAPVSSLAGGALELAADPSMYIPVGEVAKLGGKVVEALGVGAKVGGIAEEKAVKSFGSMLRDYRTITKNVPNALEHENQIAELGRFGLDSGIVQGGDDVKGIYKKASALRQSTGEELGNIYKTVKMQAGSPAVQASISDAAKTKIADSQIVPDRLAQNLKNDIKIQFAGKAGNTTAIPKLETLVDEVLQGDKPIDITKAHEIRRDIDAQINYESTKANKELPLYQNGLITIRQGIDRAIKGNISAYDAALGNDLTKQLISKNDTFSKAATIEKISGDRVKRVTANRFISPSSTYLGGLTGVAGGAGGFASGHDFTDRLKRGAEGALLGVAAGGLNQLLLNRGNSTTASLLNKLSKTSVASPAALNTLKVSRAADVISNSQKRKQAIKGANQ